MQRLIAAMAAPACGLLFCGLLFCGLMLAAGPAFATTPATGVQAEQAADPPSLAARTMVWIAAEQRAWHRDLVDHMRSLSGGSTGALTAAWALILASFLYGLFHAAGPGHGKVVLASYLLTHPQRLRRGILLAVASAFCQGLVAVLLIYGLLYLVDLVPRETRAAVNWTERTSFALLAGLGLWLVFRALRDGYRLARGSGSAHGHAHHHGHDHDHGHGCGHAHAPTGTQIERAGDLRGAIGVVLSVGLRPCSGAILVLVLAHAMALPLAGLGAVIAMSAGTALAVAGLALVAVHARQWAAALAGGNRPGAGRGIAFAGAAARLGAGALILVFGAMLFAASFAPAHPLAM